MKIKMIWTVLLPALITSWTNAQTAREIIDRSMESISFPAMEMNSTLKILDSKNRERIRQIYTVSREFNGVSKTRIEFTAPADLKGTAMLIYDYKDKDDDMWIYLPALRKTRRIVSSEKGKSFMGSEFSNADMAKPNSNDFIHKIVKEESYNGKNCWVLESRCKDEDREDMYGYSRKLAWIDRQTYLCYRIEYYDFDNNLYKVQSLENYKKESNGRYFAYLMKMENRENGRSSIMTINEFKDSVDQPESSFTPAMLSH